MAVNDVFKMAFINTTPQADGDVIFTHHYRQTAQVTPLVGNLLVQDVVDAWQADAQPAYLTVLSDENTFDEIQARGITNPIFGVDVAVGVSGDRPSLLAGIMPPRNTAVVSLRTGLIGRSFRGRFFLPAMNEDDVNNGILNATYHSLIGDYTADATLITGPGSANEYSLTIYSPTLTGVGPVIDNLVTNALVRFQVGSQRRRRPVG